MNVMRIGEYNAVVSYDPEIGMFRGEFTGLNGSADFYAGDVDRLRREGERSLKIFLEECKRRGVEAKRQFSGKWMQRSTKALHEAVTLAAAARGLSVNQFVNEVLEEATHTD
ncbi:type II toxin-antitoxin system HicB family antitoxin [Pararobbsia silviterrae]|uniref:Type II toxin-antitoxin system HicB family antitoxin n=2 Tax=Pararobbsia silviterrae TaxID=1792498 RepID=A0A494XVT0_9BURK|nr:type II toxin-antitoxin system HicB family antitoxin [Pararobbsia silviterrae]